MNQAVQSVAGKSHREWFANFDDDLWYWANTEGYRTDPLIQRALPSMPDAGTQEAFIGSSGDDALWEAFGAYRLFKQLYEKHVGSIASCKAVLDYGCGWGRILRFFLKDIDAKGLWGIDVSDQAIAICRQTNPWCQFERNNPMPPTNFDPDTFDLIYCYSVFSHLSEDAHRRWLQEFRRILRPGGLLIATTWYRDFIKYTADLRKDKDLPCETTWRRALGEAFPNTEQHLADYDAGKFCFSPYDQEAFPGFYLDGVPYYGEACIPKSYVLNHWTEHFNFAEFIDDRSKCAQNVIAVTRK